MKGKPGVCVAPKTKKNSIYKSDLYTLLKERLPNRFICDDGRLDTSKLARELGMARYSLYRWFNGETMRVTSAEKLVAISTEANCERKGALTIDMLTKFILGF